MKNQLSKLTQRLVDDPLVTEKLRLVDDVIQMRTHRGRTMDLPEEHEDLQALVDTYSNDLPQFVQYVRDLRDTVDPRSDAYLNLHEFYRTLEVRRVQQERRERVKRALMWLEKHHPRMAYEQKQRWARKVESAWGKRRLRMMEAARRGTSTGRITVEEREQLLKEFWSEVDAEIDTGKLPAP